MREGRVWRFKGGYVWWPYICEERRVDEVIREREGGRSTCDTDVDASVSEDKYA